MIKGENKKFSLQDLNLSENNFVISSGFWRGRFLFFF